MDRALFNYCSDVLGLREVLKPREMSHDSVILSLSGKREGEESAVSENAMGDEEARMSLRSEKSEEKERRAEESLETSSFSSWVTWGALDRLVFLLFHSQPQAFWESEEGALLTKMLVAMKESPEHVGLVFVKDQAKLPSVLGVKSRVRVVLTEFGKETSDFHQLQETEEGLLIKTHSLHELLTQNHLKKQTWLDLQKVMKVLSE